MHPGDNVVVMYVDVVGIVDSVVSKFVVEGVNIVEDVEVVGLDVVVVSKK